MLFLSLLTKFFISERTIVVPGRTTVVPERTIVVPGRTTVVPAEAGI